MKTAQPFRMTKGQRTKEKIALCFLDLISQKPWDRITVRAICETAAVSRATFYEHFEDTSDLMEGIHRYLLSDLQDRFRRCRLSRSAESGFCAEPSAWKEPPPDFLAWYQFCLAHKAALLALTDEEKGDSYFRQRIQAVIVRDLNELMDRDGLPTNAMRTYFQALFSGFFLDSMRLWLSTNVQVPATHMVHVLNTFRLGGICCCLSKRTGGSLPCGDPRILA